MAVGLAVGWVIVQIRKRLDDVPIEVTVSLLTGYAAYVPAEQLHVSGVLAAVAAGVYVGWHAPRIASARTRLTSYSVWEILNFLLNATLFLLVGLQLGVMLDGGLGDHSTGELIALGAAVSAAVIVARIVWTQMATTVIRTLDRRESQRARRAQLAVPPHRLVERHARRGVAGRGAGAAADDRLGRPVPRARPSDLFLTFCVILATLVLQGLTLPWLIRRLDMRDDGGEREEELRARMAAARAAVERVDEMAEWEWTRDDTIERMRGMYTYRARRFKAQAGTMDGTDDIEERSTNYQRMLRLVIEAQRDALLELRNDGTISTDVMRRVEHELDLEEDRLEICARGPHDPPPRAHARRRAGRPAAGRVLAPGLGERSRRGGRRQGARARRRLRQAPALPLRGRPVGARAPGPVRRLPALQAARARPRARPPGCASWATSAAWTWPAP